MSGLYTKFKAGFSLIEINLVLLIVGIALVSLMGLFPVGLREADAAAADTEQAVFAERVLNAIQARANSITNAAVWNNEEAFVEEIGRGLDLKFASSSVSLDIIEKGEDDKDSRINNYPVQKSYIRYRIKISRILSKTNQQGERDNPDREYGYNLSGDRFMRLYRASVWVSNRRTGDAGNNTPYTTYLFYQGVE